MYIFLTSIILIIAVLLIFIVTIQNSKGGGLASGFASSNQIMGVRKTTDLLEKLTWGLTGALVILCFFTARYAPRTVNVRQDSQISDYVDKATIPAPADAQPFGGDQPATTPAETPATTPAETPEQN